MAALKWTGLRIAVAVAAVACTAGAFTPVLAQKSAPAITRDTDRDGVPDVRDRCRATPAGTRVDDNGCPAPAAPTPAPQAAAQPAPGQRPTAAPGAAPAGAPAPSLAAQLQGQPTGQPPPAQTPPAQPAQTPPAQTPPAQTPAAAATPQPQAVQPPAAAPGAAQPGARPAGAPAVTGAPTVAVPPTPAPVGAPAARPAGQPSAPARRPPIAVDPSLTAGFWIPAYGGSSDAEKLEYARTLALRADSAINALVDVFRGTSGAPMVGASEPNVISTREKGRWDRCRLIHFDLRTLGDAAAFLRDSMPGGPTLQARALTMADAFENLQATEECDNLVSMMEAPDRWAPWRQNYETSAGNFYRDWYTQLRALHETIRAFVRTVNPSLGARALAMPPAMPPAPPTIGGVR